MLNTLTLNITVRLLSASIALLGLTACSMLPGGTVGSADEASVIYALPPAAGFSSPLDTTLRTACAPLDFEDSSLGVTSEHEEVLAQFVALTQKEPKTRYLVVGYTTPDLPEDHARVLSDRRALGVRQRLIELGVEPGRLQCAGFGNDFARSSHSRHVVLIYRQ